jgi:glucokinase
MTLEDIASGPNSVQWARSQGWSGTSGEELAQGATDGDQLAIRAIRRSARAVGAAIASAAALLDLEAAIIGGGFSLVSPDYVKKIQVEAQRVASAPFARSVRVERAELGTAAPLVGAAALVYRPELISTQNEATTS